MVVIGLLTLLIGIFLWRNRHSIGFNPNDD